LPIRHLIEISETKRQKRVLRHIENVYKLLLQVWRFAFVAAKVKN